MVNWERLFDQLEINAQVAAFIETTLNVFQNYVPNKYITVDNKDPVWMNENIKTKIKEKNTFYQKYIENGRLESDFILLEKLITELNDLIFSTKTLYYENLAKKLNNPLLQTKTYWSILKTFYNNKKIPQIPPLLEDDKFVTDMKTKVDILIIFLQSNVHP